MREDMAKVIVERPRRGSRWKKPCRGAERRFRCKEPVDRAEQLPRKWMSGFVGTTRTVGFGHKSLSEHLSPLKRFLHKNIGRPWNKVYAEIVGKLRLDNAVQRHVLEHLPDFVGVHTRMEDGTVMYLRWGRLVPVNKDGPWLFVDPRTAILRRNRCYSGWKYRWKAEKKRMEDEVRESARPVPGKPDNEYLKVKGIWFEVARAWYTHPEGHRQYVVIAKRQLNGTELKELGLKNEHEWKAQRICPQSRRCGITRKHYVGNPWFRRQC